MSNRNWRIAVAAITVATTLVFVYRGCWRALSRSTDFAVVYSATRAWVRGANPYDRTVLEQLWLNAGGPHDYKPFDRPSLYPPTTLVLLAPLSIANWSQARFAWLIANVAALALATGMLLRRAELPRGSMRWWALVILALGLSPVHGAVSLGQMCLLPFACALAANGPLRESKPVVAGVLLAIATALKPQVGGLYWLFAAWHGRWRTFGVGAATLLALSLVGAGQLRRHDIDFVRPLLETARKYSTEGFSDPSQTNPFRHEMLNLQVVLHGFLHDRVIVNAATGIAMLALAFVALPPSLLSHRRAVDSRSASDRDHADSLFETSIVSVLTLLAVYHRSYDAVLLLAPTAWALRQLGADSTQRCFAIAALAMIAVFVVPGSAILYELQKAGQIPSAIESTWVWRNVILLHQAWSIAALALVLTMSARRSATARTNAIQPWRATL